MEVHRELRAGFVESVYQESLQIECELRGIPLEREKHLPLRYKQKTLQARFRADFVCYGSLLVECKALPSLGNVELAQVLNYLRCLGFERGLLLNFGTRSLQYRRVIWTDRP